MPTQTHTAACATQRIAQESSIHAASGRYLSINPESSEGRCDYCNRSRNRERPRDKAFYLVVTMIRSREGYEKVTEGVRKGYEKVTSGLRKGYEKVTQILRKGYERVTKR
jgi:hypothetical protein